MRRQFVVSSMSEALEHLIQHERRNFDLIIRGRDLEPLVLVEPVGVGTAILPNGPVMAPPTIVGAIIRPYENETFTDTVDLPVIRELEPGSFRTSFALTANLDSRFARIMIPPESTVLSELSRDEHTGGFVRLDENTNWREYIVNDMRLRISPSQRFMTQMFDRTFISPDMQSHYSTAAITALLRHYFHVNGDEEFTLRLRRTQNGTIGRAFFSGGYTLVNDVELLRAISSVTQSTGCTPSIVDWDEDASLHMIFNTGSQALSGNIRAVTGFSVTNSETGVAALKVRPILSVGVTGMANRYLNGEQTVNMLFKLDANTNVKMRHIHHERNDMIQSAQEAILTAVQRSSEFTTYLDAARERVIGTETLKTLLTTLTRKYRLTTIERNTIKDYHTLVDDSALGICIALAVAGRQSSRQQRSIELSEAAGEALITDGLF